MNMIVVVSCDDRALGCLGGYPELAYRYIMDSGGIVSDKLYPYTSYGGKSATCNRNQYNYMVILYDLILYGDLTWKNDL